MNGTGTYSDDERRRLQSMGKPRLADRIQDDPLARDAPYEADQAPPIEPPAPGGMTFQDQPPPQPRLAQRVLGGFEGQPGGGTGGLVGRVARGALSGALGPTQRQDIESERLGSQRISGELATGAQRIGGEEALESQREAYSLPEQRARIAQQSAQTAQERLSTMILQQQLEMMNRGDIYAGNYTDEQKAYINSEMALRGPKGAADAIRAVQQQNAIAGRIGPGTNVYDPNAPGGVSREFMTRGGQPMPGATVRGAVVPGTLPRAETSEQLVPTAEGGMAAVGKSRTVAPQLPGQPTAGGGGGIRDIPITPATSGFGREQVKELDKYVTNYRDIQQLEREQNDILKQVQGEYLNGPQSMQFLANHISLTMGRVKGARSGRDIIEAHIKARDLGQSLDAIASRVLAGGVLTNSQARQMLGTTTIKRTESLRTLMEQADSAGMEVQMNNATGAVRVVPRAR